MIKKKSNANMKFVKCFACQLIRLWCESRGIFMFSRDSYSNGSQCLSSMKHLTVDSCFAREMAAQSFLCFISSLIGTNGASFTFADRSVKHEGQTAVGQRRVSGATDSLIFFPFAFNCFISSFPPGSNYIGGSSLCSVFIISLSFFLAWKEPI